MYTCIRNKISELREARRRKETTPLSTCGFLFHRHLVKKKKRELIYFSKEIPLLPLSISTQLRINELPRISCGLLCFAIILFFFFWLDNRARPYATHTRIREKKQTKTSEPTSYIWVRYTQVFEGC